MLLRCLDRQVPEELGRTAVATARLLASVPWIRTPDGWTGDTFEGLADHLLRAVAYPLPPFLYPRLYASTSTTPDAVLALQVLAFVAAGNALRRAPMLPPLTAREAHLLWTTETAETVIGAVRRAQVLAAGGPEWLAVALGRTRLAQRDGDEPYWRKGIGWLSAHAAELEPDRIGPIVDFLNTARAVPTSVSRLLREERAWHAVQRPGLAARSGPLPRSGLPSVRLEADGAIWSFGEIDTGEALQAEGAALAHCVATYHALITAGRSSIWSVRREGERCLTIEVWNADRAVVQIRGLRNRRATVEEQALIERWAASMELAVRDRSGG